MMPAALSTAAKRCRNETPPTVTLAEAAAGLRILLSQGVDGVQSVVDASLLRSSLAEQLGHYLSAVLRILHDLPIDIDDAWMRWVRSAAARRGIDADSLISSAELRDEGEGAVGKLMCVAAGFADASGRRGAWSEAALEEGARMLIRLHRAGDRERVIAKGMELLFGVASVAHARGFGPALMWMKASGRLIAPSR